MVALKITGNNDTELTDTLVFITLSDKDRKGIADKVHAKMQDLLNVSEDYYSAFDRLMDWCGTEFGEKPHWIEAQEIDVEWAGGDVSRENPDTDERMVRR